MINPIYKITKTAEDAVYTAPSKFFKKCLDSTGVETQRLYAYCREKSRDLGTIPHVFLHNIKPENRASAAINLRELFSLLSGELQNADKTEINKILNKYAGLISKQTKTPIRISKLNSGSTATAFKIDIEGKSYVLKSFKNDGQKTAFIGDGQAVEPVLGKFTKHNVHSGGAASFEFGRVAPYGENDGFIVTRFLPQNAQPRIKNISLLQISNPVIFNDFIRGGENNIGLNLNHINGIVYDLGRIELKKHFPNDKETAKMIRIICQLADRGAVKEMETYLAENSSNPKLAEAKRYLYSEAWKNKFFNEDWMNDVFTENQIKALNLAGLNM